MDFLFDRMRNVVVNTASKKQMIRKIMHRTAMRFGFLVRNHGSENWELRWKQMNCLFGWVELKPQTPFSDWQDLQLEKYESFWSFSSHSISMPCFKKVSRNSRMSDWQPCGDV